MVDAGEKVSQTVRREFGEEAFNTLKMDPNKKKELEAKLKEFFKHGVKVSVQRFICWLLIIIIIFYFENVAFFHAKLG